MFITNTLNFLRNVKKTQKRYQPIDYLSDATYAKSDLPNANKTLP